MGCEHRHRPGRVARDIGAKRPGNRSDGGEQIGTLTPSGWYEGADGQARDEDATTGDPVVGDELGGQRRDEPDVVDSLAIRNGGAPAVGPTQVDAVGVGHDEPVGVGNRVVAGQCGLSATGAACGMQVDHQRRRTFDADRRMHHVRARQTAVVELSGLGGNGGCMGYGRQGRCREATREQDCGEA